MTTTFLLAMLLVGAPIRPEPAVETQTGACTVDNSKGRAMAVRFLTSPSLAGTRQAAGMGAVNASNLRLLTPLRDSAVCQALSTKVQLPAARYPRTLTFYYADGFYFVPVTWIVPQDRIWIAHAPLLVFDQNLNLVDSYAM